MGSEPSPSSRQPGYRLVTRYLEEAGVDTVFTLLSGGIQHFVADIQGRDTIAVVHARHEQSALAMADGYARRSDRPGVCIVGRGPGIAQMGTALITARNHGSNLVVIVPDSAMTGAYRIDYQAKYDLKHFGLEPFLRSTIGDVISINSQDMLLRYLKDAFRQAAIGEGPVAVRIPEDVLNTEAELPDSIPVDALVPADRYGAPGAELQPDPGSVERAVDRYLDSDATRPPVILVGLGAVRADARPAIEAVAERMNAVIAATLQARGYLADHPYYLGFVGGKGRNIANEYLADCDFLLAVGCSLNIRTMDRFQVLAEDATVVHVDRDVGAIDRFTPVDVGITGDATATLRAIERELEREGIDRSGAFWTDRFRREIAEAPHFDQREYPSQPGTIDPRALIEALDGILPPDRLIVHDGGQQNNWALDGLAITHPDRFIWTMDFFSTGLALPMAVGAALAGESPVVSFAGDVGFMMSLQELDTAVRYRLPILQFVMNNDAFGVEHQHLLHAGDHAETALIEAPDFAAVAAAMGADGYTVASLGDLEEIEALLAAPPTAPVVVECLLDRNVVHREFA